MARSASIAVATGRAEIARRRLLDDLDALGYPLVVDRAYFAVPAVDQYADFEIARCRGIEVA